jgi:hypothetical protein
LSNEKQQEGRTLCCGTTGSERKKEGDQESTILDDPIIMVVANTNQGTHAYGGVLTQRLEMEMNGGFEEPPPPCIERSWEFALVSFLPDVYVAASSWSLSLAGD